MLPRDTSCKSKFSSFIVIYSTNQYIIYSSIKRNLLETLIRSIGIKLVYKKKMTCSSVLRTNVLFYIYFNNSLEHYILMNMKMLKIFLIVFISIIFQCFVFLTLLYLFQANVIL